MHGLIRITVTILADKSIPPTGLSDVTAAVKQYERLREQRNKCNLTWVQPVNCIVLNGVQHAGVVSHRCANRYDHTDICKCTCNATNKNK